MTNHDLQEEIDQLAVKVERKIEENKQFLADLPDFAPRSNRSKKLPQGVGKNQ